MEEVKTRPLSDYVDKIEFSVLHFGLIKMIQNKSGKVLLFRRFRLSAKRHRAPWLTLIEFIPGFLRCR